jgi:hypothetical protein
MQLSTSYLPCWIINTTWSFAKWGLTVDYFFNTWFLLCLLFTILAASLKLTISYMFSSLLLFLVFGHPIFCIFLFHLFTYPNRLYTADFSKFSHWFSKLVSFVFILFKWSFTLCVCSHFMLLSFKDLLKKILYACLPVGFRKLFIFGNQISNELEI